MPHLVLGVADELPPHPGVVGLLGGAGEVPRAKGLGLRELAEAVFRLAPEQEAGDGGVHGVESTAGSRPRQGCRDLRPPPARALRGSRGGAVGTDLAPLRATIWETP